MRGAEKIEQLLADHGCRSGGSARIRSDEEGRQAPPPRDLAGASNGNDHVPDEVQPNDLRSRALLEVAVNGVADHLLQDVERVRLGIDGLAEGSGLEAALGGFIDEKDDLAGSHGLEAPGDLRMY
jgi:hypothetical protein